MQNPYIALLRTAWTYARHEKRQYILVYFLFMLANIAYDIVLLDEPTISVDPKTELAIYRELLREFADKAVVSTLHRLHLLPLFDYIYIMQNGKIVDEGSFSDLHQ